MKTIEADIMEFISKDLIDRLLTLLPDFEGGEFAGADAHYRQTGQYLPQVVRLCEMISESGSVLSFDWVAWKNLKPPKFLRQKESLRPTSLLFGRFSPIVCSRTASSAVFYPWSVPMG